MFILANSSGRFIMLRCCECDKTMFVETDKFKTIAEDHVVLKDNINISCDNCGKSQPNDKKYIPLEQQIIREQYQPTSNLPYWMTRDITTEELMSAITWD